MEMIIHPRGRRINGKQSQEPVYGAVQRSRWSLTSTTGLIYRDRHYDLTGAVPSRSTITRLSSRLPAVSAQCQTVNGKRQKDRGQQKQAIAILKVNIFHSTSIRTESASVVSKWRHTFQGMSWQSSGHKERRLRGSFWLAICCCFSNSEIFV